MVGDLTLLVSFYIASVQKTRYQVPGFAPARLIEAHKRERGAVFGIRVTLTSVTWCRLWSATSAFGLDKAKGPFHRGTRSPESRGRRKDQLTPSRIIGTPPPNSWITSSRVRREACRCSVLRGGLKLTDALQRSQRPATLAIQSTRQGTHPPPA
jgi:hypothetical protein